MAIFCEKGMPKSPYLCFLAEILCFLLMGSTFTVPRIWCKCRGMSRLIRACLSMLCIFAVCGCGTGRRAAPEREPDRSGLFAARGREHLAYTEQPFDQQMPPKRPASRSCSMTPCRTLRTRSRRYAPSSRTRWTSSRFHRWWRRAGIPCWGRPRTPAFR